MNTVYVMRFGDGSEYVGSTTNFKERRKEHRKKIRLRTHTPRVLDVFDRYGPPVFEAVASALHVNHLLSVEADVVEARRPVLNTYPVVRTGKHTFVGPVRPDGVILLDGIVDFPCRHKRRLKKMPSPPRMITAAGRTLSISDWARECGIDKQTIRSRLDILEWTPEQAVGITPPPKAVKRAVKTPRKVSNGVVAYGGFVDSLRGLCKRFSVNYSRAYYRYKTGYPMDEVFRK